MATEINKPASRIPETVQPIPPIIAAIDVDSYDKAAAFINAFDEIPADQLGFKIPHGLAMRHYDRFVPGLRAAGRFTIVDSRFNDYTHKIDDELSTALETDLEQDQFGNPPHDLPNAFTMLAILEGERGDREKMTQTIIPRAHRLGIRVLGIMPPIRIGNNDNDQLADQAFNRYKDAAELNIDALDIPEPALDRFFRYSLDPHEVQIIVSRFGKKIEENPSKEERYDKEHLAETLGRAFQNQRVVSAYLGRPLLELANDAERVDCVKRCLDKIQ